MSKKCAKRSASKQNQIAEDRRFVAEAEGAEAEARTRAEAEFGDSEEDCDLRELM
jgi:hypothetical protein